MTEVHAGERPGVLAGWRGHCGAAWCACAASLLIAGFAIDEMWRVLSLGGITPLEGVVLLLFSVNMTWISLPAVTGLIGMVRLLVEAQAGAPGAATV